MWVGVREPRVQIRSKEPNEIFASLFTVHSNNEHQTQAHVQTQLALHHGLLRLTEQEGSMVRTKRIVSSLLRAVSDSLVVILTTVTDGLSNADSASDDREPAVTQARLRATLTAVEVASLQLGKSLSNISKINSLESGQYLLQHSSFPLTELVCSQSAVQDALTQATARQIHFEVLVAPNLEHTIVMGDREQLTSVIRVFLETLLVRTPNAGRFWIELRATPQISARSPHPTLVASIVLKHTATDGKSDDISQYYSRLLSMLGDPTTSLPLDYDEVDSLSFVASRMVVEKGYQGVIRPVLEQQVVGLHAELVLSTPITAQPNAPHTIMPIPNNFPSYGQARFTVPERLEPVPENL
eukprot:c17306_g1_i1.p1 GENE.c17306_g1_i1~~c17306_g1_i1.p1  ORF type:complete len:355 (-),score=46.50 c17306_g1_i1:57-1121(-)